uniref:Fucosyltransferase n=4 Tax=Clastoptera arizonana TaxID=38151 RepID=A0A1B6C7E5_9HEMI
MPLPRNENKLIWALLHEESPRNIPALSNENILVLFNYTATFSRHSDFPLTTQYIKNLDMLVDRIDTFLSEELLYFIARYKFVLAIENGECEDYITEKLWRPLISGSIPIYLGSPSIKDWLPNNNSAILIWDFPSPKHLAEYLIQLDNDEEKYNLYLEHKLEKKLEYKIKNKRLISTMANRTWKINDFGDDNYIEQFECFVCKKVHKHPDTYHFADIHHYNCPKPKSSLTKQQNLSNVWLEEWRKGECEAKVFKNFVYLKGENYSIQAFNNEVFKYYKMGLC